jgi:hypothetical protein
MHWQDQLPTTSCRICICELESNYGDPQTNPKDLWANSLQYNSAPLLMTFELSPKGQFFHCERMQSMLQASQKTPTLEDAVNAVAAKQPWNIFGTRRSQSYRCNRTWLQSSHPSSSRCWEWSETVIWTSYSYDDMISLHRAHWPGRSSHCIGACGQLLDRD